MIDSVLNRRQCSAPGVPFFVLAVFSCKEMIMVAYQDPTTVLCNSKLYSFTERNGDKKKNRTCRVLHWLGFYTMSTKTIVHMDFKDVSDF